MSGDTSSDKGSISSEDPRLTAYALGEMSGEELTAFELEIAGDRDIEREIAEIASAAEWLGAELRDAPDSLGPAQREAIAAALARREEASVVLPSAGQPDMERSEDLAKPDTEPKSEPLADVVPIGAATKREAKSRALWVALPAVAAAAAFLVFGTSTLHRSLPSEEGATMASAAAPASTSEADALAQRSDHSIDGAEFRSQSKRKSERLGIRGDSGDALGPPSNVQGIAPMARPIGILEAPTKFDGPAPGNRLGARAPLPSRIEDRVQPLPEENPFIETVKDAKSTFSIDVDTAGYAVVRKSIETGSLPPPYAVRVEEMINYFPYSDRAPSDEAFAVTTAVAAAPWAEDHRLLRIGVKGREVPMKARSASNLVFLLDVSGSMMGPDRLGLVKEGMKLLVRQLGKSDRVSIVVYAGAAGLVLPPTPGSDRVTILEAIDRLQAGGSTNGGEGIQLAYAQAAASFVQGGTNRVLLATDGDFNVGVSSQDELIRLAQEKAKTGVFLTVLGFGQGNLRDSTLEQVADKGNGHYAYIDSLGEAKKVLVEQAAGTLVTIAKDVKIQIAFEPSAVRGFRLIGYENRILAHQDFADDNKDAGEIGAGHTVTALYEIVPASKEAKAGTSLASLALRFKMPDGATSRQVDFPVIDGGGSFESAPVDLRFGAAVAGFGMKLRGSRLLGDFGFADASRIAEGALGEDVGGHRRGFVALVQKAQALGR